MIAGENVHLLQGIKGVGKKTAELLVVELRDKCEALVAGWGDGSEAIARAGAHDGAAPDRHPMLVDVAAALNQLGWKASEVDRAVAGLTVAEGVSLETLIRQALRQAMQTLAR
jgi:Holliday junction resolvasome RuvABC DNA-binding subunit